MAIEVLQSSGQLRLKVTGTSMLPTLWPGDLLTIESVHPQQISRGDIVLYERAGRMFIHRVVRVTAGGECSITTRGDSMPGDDLPVSLSEILGRVSEFQRGNQTTAISATMGLPQRLLGWLFCRSVLLCQLGLRYHAMRNGPASRETAIVTASSA
jgi:signal peptidase I